MPSERLQFQQSVPFPLDHVFAFFSNPLNLPRIMPTDSGAKIEQLNRVAPPDSRGAAADVAAGVGSTMVTRFASFLFFPCARGGSPGSPNSNGIITSLSGVRRKARSRTGVTVTNFSRKRVQESPERSSST